MTNWAIEIKRNKITQNKSTKS